MPPGDGPVAGTFAVPTYDWDGASAMDAAVAGTLWFTAEGCTLMGNAEGGKEVTRAVFFPDATGVTYDNGVRAVVDSTGDVFAVEGQSFSYGGGFVVTPDSALGRRWADQCPGAELREHLAGRGRDAAAACGRIGAAAPHGRSASCLPVGAPVEEEAMERPPGVPASFDVRTVVYLRRGTSPPVLSEEASTALHHQHLAYLADLGRRGIIAANGPLLDQSDETMRGMAVYTVDASEARRLAEQDPAVRAGRFRVDVARWAVAAGRITFPEADGPVGRRVPFADL